MKQRLVIANWKLNMPAEGMDGFVKAVSEERVEAQLVIAPPFPFLVTLAQSIRETRSSVQLGAQNCSDHASGAFTGEVSAPMLAEVGTRYVIVGHSERRSIYGESDELVGRKVKAVLAAGMTPVVCIGEDEATREAGGTGSILERQIVGALEGLERGGEVVVAYEPVWAIGTGKNASPSLVSDTHGTIRRLVDRVIPGRVQTIVYGGSVTPDNAADLAAVEGVDGFLVGGASLFSAKFLAIGRATAG